VVTMAVLLSVLLSLDGASSALRWITSVNEVNDRGGISRGQRGYGDDVKSEKSAHKRLLVRSKPIRGANRFPRLIAWCLEIIACINETEDGI
jgi:hypothetical protein